jgi:hypothetical protein
MTTLDLSSAMVALSIALKGTILITATVRPKMAALLAPESFPFANKSGPITG